MNARDDSQSMILNYPPNVQNGVIGPVLPFANSFFLKWNIPYAAMCRLQVRAFDHGSPLAFFIPTPGSDIAVTTPPSAPSPHDAPSPTASVLQSKKRLDRALLFAQGEHDKLLMSMDNEEKTIMFEWLHQYWFFCFKTAKYWGKGPLAWTATLLDFDRFQSHSVRNLPATPGAPGTHSTNQLGDDIIPLSHCRWFIHVNAQRYEPIQEGIEEPRFQDWVEQDPNDESTWSPWPTNQIEPPLPARLRDALEHNDFSSISATTLPVAIPEVAKAAQRSPDELLLESLGFSIMSRNVEQTASIMEQLDNENIDYKSAFPLHMAASYLDGYKTCCSTFNVLTKSIQGPKFRDMYVNELGHSVLDSFMISILRSHSSVAPIVYDSSLKDTLRFIGEEVDICGRWDADSPCIRNLLASNNPLTPFAWKHKFCHTSIQTMWHCMDLLFCVAPGRLIRETASGLYVHHCFECGTKLEPQPLHSLTITAYHLANNGCEDEDLFGMLAILLYLIGCGLNPRQTANISVTALIEGRSVECLWGHEDLTPSQLAKSISTHSMFNIRTEKARTGWAVFCGILSLCEDIQTNPGKDTSREGMSGNEFFRHHFIGTTEPNQDLQDVHFQAHGEKSPFQSQRNLATLWASVQAELLSYRRVDDEDDWISPRFSMERLKGQLERGEPLSVGYADQNLLQPHCICGDFGAWPFPKLSDATDPDIANLDIWDRATYAYVDLEE
ncbi:hypothetical protein BKA66DRAFT_569837 [Pyrenochaeta sp. MPI-SDFR-AT-0127]|nr:hypothetical protein BKA66DRAFT_569837 [Pyrenochaeta sp. MPI-SDFR-AT-0127]